MNAKQLREQQRGILSTGCSFEKSVSDAFFVRCPPALNHSWARFNLIRHRRKHAPRQEDSAMDIRTLLDKSRRLRSSQRSW